jgi:hypothetical protein
VPRNPAEREHNSIFISHIFLKYSLFSKAVFTRAAGDAVDHLRANASLKPSLYSIPVPGLIFLNEYADLKFGMNGIPAARKRLIGKCNLLRLDLPDKFNLVMFRKMGESGSPTTFMLAGVYYCTTV